MKLRDFLKIANGAIELRDASDFSAFLGDALKDDQKTIKNLTKEYGDRIIKKIEPLKDYEGFYIEIM